MLEGLSFNNKDVTFVVTREHIFCKKKKNVSILIKRNMLHNKILKRTCFS